MSATEPSPGPEDAAALKAAFDVFTRVAVEPPERRAAALDEACGGDAALRARVEGLLAADAAPARWDAAWADGVAGAIAQALDATPVDGGADDESPPPPPRVGPYRIVRLIGTGGMGRVYEAEEASPRRRVALKVVRPELVSPELRRRFALEAEALARLAHPGIARVYAVGLDPGPDTPPWIAMELVTGSSLLEHARRQALSTDARLELLARVADAVAHAHARGVIHRDLKPSNVLVDETGQPKVVDFGVARLTDEATRLTTLHSRYGRLVGTVAYMSPEQAAGRPEGVDARSDVYALGVLGYELLAGRPPLDVAGKPIPVAVRLVAESDPPTLGSVDGALRGDVSILVARAMAREPDRRYATAAAFADDLRRYLRHEPILARPPTATYQVRKFVRRHRGLVAGLVVAFVALATGLILALSTAAERERERVRADRLATERTRAAYRAEIAGAAAALRNLDPVTVRRRLSLADPASRGWEWAWLDARVASALEERAFRRPLRVPPAPSSTGDRLLWLRPYEVRTTTWDAPEPADGPAPPTPPPFVRWLVWAGAAHDAPGLVLAQTGPGRIVDPVTGGERTFTMVGSVGPSMLAPDGASVVTSAFAHESPDHEAHLRLYDVADGRVRWDRTGPEFQSTSLRFVDGGTTLLAGGNDGRVRFLDARTGEVRRTSDTMQNIVLDLAVSNDGRRFATAGEDRSIRLANVADGGDARTLRGHGGRVLDVAFSPSGHRLASASSDGTVRLWDAVEGDLLATFDVAEAAAGADVAFDAEGATLRVATTTRLLAFAAERDEGARVLRPHRGRAEGNPYPYVYAVAVHPSGAIVASGGWDRTIRLSDARLGDRLATIEVPDIPYAIAFDATGTHLVVTCAAGLLRVYALATGAAVLAHDEGPPKAVEYPLALHPAEPIALVTDRENRVTLVDVVTGDVRRRDPGARADDLVTALAFSKDGTRYAFGTRAGEAALVDFASGRRIASLPSHRGAVFDLAFSLDGSRLASGCNDGLARVFDGRDGAPVSTLSGHAGPVFAVTFAADGSRLFTGGDDGTIRIWDPAGGDDLLAMSGHDAYVYDLVVAPGGRGLASVSGDNTVRLWTLESAAERRRRTEAHAVHRARYAAQLAASPGDAEAAGFGAEDPGAALAARLAARPSARLPVTPAKPR